MKPVFGITPTHRETTLKEMRSHQHSSFLQMLHLAPKYKYLNFFFNFFLISDNLFLMHLKKSIWHLEPRYHSLFVSMH